MSYEIEINYIDKQIKHTEISIEKARAKPNCSLKEIDNLLSKLSILKNIRKKLSE